MFSFIGFLGLFWTRVTERGELTTKLELLHSTRLYASLVRLKVAYNNLFK